MDGRWPYNCCFGGCCLQDLFNIACSILVLFPSSLFSSHLVSIHVVHPYSSIDTIAAWKKLNFILSVSSLVVHSFKIIIGLSHIVWNWIHIFFFSFFFFFSNHIIFMNKMGLDIWFNGHWSWFFFSWTCLWPGKETWKRNWVKQIS